MTTRKSEEFALLRRAPMELVRWKAADGERRTEVYTRNQALKMMLLASAERERLRYREPLLTRWQRMFEVGLVLAAGGALGLVAWWPRLF